MSDVSPAMAVSSAARSSGSIDSNGSLKWAIGLLLAGAWIFAAISMVSFNWADWPSHAVAVHNTPTANLGGAMGALLAYWSYHLVGLGAWIVLIALGAWLVLEFMGRSPGHCTLRMVGLLLAAVSFSTLHALVLPTSLGMAPSPGGIVGHAIAGALVPAMGMLGSVMVVLALLLAGLTVAADELMLALPGALWRGAKATAARTPRPKRGLLKRLSLRPEHAPRTPRKPLDVVEVDDEVEPEDEWEDEWEDEEEEEEEDEEAWDEVEDEWEEEEDEEAAPEPKPRKKFTRAQLREKIASIPGKFFGGATEEAKDEDLQRETWEGYEFPTVEVLESPETDFSEKVEEMVREQAQILEETLNTYDIEADVTGIESGPTVTLYSVRLAPGTRVSRIKSIDQDIARELGAQNIRIVPNTAGRTSVGIEVPNPTREKVRLKELISSGAAKDMVLPMFLGKDASGEPLVEDLTRMPHMLVSGTTGSGKSVCINTIIMSWLFLKRPDEVKLILVDPKMVELKMFADIPHLACPVVTEMNRAAAILEWAVRKMEERYALLAEAGVRDIRSYNDLTNDERIEIFEPENDVEEARILAKLPYIVFVIDELADLMMTNKEVEQSIVRIAQKARAVGIHLILATQRPSAQVVTGLIKSNMPCRMSFKVSSGMDSRIVLDTKGAELLLGHGDMMLVTPQKPNVRRAQGTLVDDRETRSVVRFLKDVAKPNFEQSLIRIKQGGDGEMGGKAVERDPLFDQAVEILIETGRGSVSLLQRRMSIGYSRASRLVDQMGTAGILSDHKGSVAREVLITQEEWEEMKAMEAEGDAGDLTYEEDPDGLDAVPDEYEDEYAA
ncbi:MAG: DNA translocase FtsK 4TM domain-containing protein [Phycisphaerales bacterium]|nr:DNA translocase FtsK 4TM domain-containing protein [Phycisphaerales bacterium]